MYTKIMTLKAKILLPLLIASLVIWASYGVITYYERNEHLKADLKYKVSSISLAYQAITDNQLHKQGVILKNIFNDPILLSAMTSHNRDLLLSRSLTIFEKLKTEHNITHFYLHDPERVNILRAHEPKRFGDTINRTSILIAEKTGQPSQGLELGPLGTFTLRSVFPIWSEHRLAGYIEIGEDIDQITQKLAHIFNVDFITLLDKQYLSAAAWEKRRSNFDHDTNWNLLSNNVISSKTINNLASKLNTFLSQPMNELLQAKEIEFSFQDRTYQGQLITMPDIQGRSIGAVLVLNDVTSIFQVFYRSLIITTGVIVFFGLIIFLIFYIILGRVEKQQRELFEELKKRELHLVEAQKLTHFGSWELDIKSGQLFWSEEVFNIFELPNHTSNISYDKFLNLVHPDDRTDVDKAFLNAVENGLPYDLIHRILMTDGRIKYVREVCKIKYGGENESPIAIGAIHDITGDKKNEERLRIAAVAFETRDSMIITDSQGTILQVNHAFTETTGYSYKEAVGNKPNMLQSNTHDKDFYRRMWESLNKTGQWQGEIIDKRKNGEEYPTWLNISAVKNNKGDTTHYVSIHSDITSRKQAESKIRMLAFYDQLTGLPNRTLFLDRLNQAMAVSHRNGAYCALLLIDLDNFKMLNDTLGHAYGDKLLSFLAQRLKGLIRAGDTISRQGGDEFLILLTGLPNESHHAAIIAEKISEKIRTAIKECDSFSDIYHSSTASIGLTLFHGYQTTKEELIKQADLAMYRSKSTGRNAIHFFDPSMETAILTRMKLEADLHLAIQEKQLLVYYQAQVDKTGRYTGAEALVRWKHPERGMVSPAEFIPVAEETEQITLIGQWVLEMTCEKLAEWSSRPEMAHLTISVNVSTKQFCQSNFIDQVLSIIRNSGADPRLLKLELTESLLAENVEDIIKTMLALKAEGVQFSLDDFGTGYSSLSYLARLPLGQLKIDLSFVRNLLTDKNASAIAQAIVMLAKSLNMDVIAEGVETELQLEHLAHLGCNHYQGYLFSRPLPIEEFEEFVQRG